MYIQWILTNVHLHKEVNLLTQKSKAVMILVVLSVFPVYSQGCQLWYPVEVPTNEDLHDLVWNGDQFVAVGGGGTILTSPDSETWTPQVSGTSLDLLGIMWGRAEFSDGYWFIAVGQDGVLLTSRDGITWIAQDSSIQDERDLRATKSNGAVFVAIGGHEREDGIIIRAFNEYEWSGGGTGNSPRTDFDLGVTPNFFITVGENTWGTESFSVGISDELDRVNWYLGPSAPLGTQGLRGVTWTSQERLIAVGLGGTILRSDPGWDTEDDDSWRWALIPSPTNQNLFVAEAGTNRVIAAGEQGVIISSINETTWQQELSSTSQTLRGIEWVADHQKFYAVGDGGTMLVRDPAEAGLQAVLGTSPQWPEQNILTLVNSLSACGD